jgi:hypothetical protein
MAIPLVNLAMLFTSCLLVLLVGGIPRPAANFIANLFRYGVSGKLKPFAKTIDWSGLSCQPQPSAQ